VIETLMKENEESNPARLWSPLCLSRPVVWIFHNLPRLPDASDKAGTRVVWLALEGCKESKEPTAGSEW